jgi:hypothetical protein
MIANDITATGGGQRIFVLFWVLVQFERGTRILRVIKGRDARATSANCTSTFLVVPEFGVSLSYDYAVLKRRFPLKLLCVLCGKITSLCPSSNISAKSVAIGSNRS